jgi:hypothetical protein
MISPSKLDFGQLRGVAEGVGQGALEGGGRFRHFMRAPGCGETHFQPNMPARGR